MDIEEEIRISTRSDIHLSPEVLLAMDLRPGDVVIARIEEGMGVMEIRGKKK